MTESEIITNYNKAVQEYCTGRACSNCVFHGDCNNNKLTQEQYDAVINLTYWSSENNKEAEWNFTRLAEED